MNLLLSAIGLAALLSMPALAAEPSELAGSWVLNQLDGHGGPGCLVDLTMTEVEGGALKLVKKNDACPDIMNDVTNWYMDGEAVILANDADERRLTLTDQTTPGDSTSYGDATYFLEQM